MREQMISVVRDMVEYGYCLHNETVEQFVDRMIEYGFGVDTMREWQAVFMAAKAR